MTVIYQNVTLLVVRGACTVNCCGSFSVKVCVGVKSQKKRQRKVPQNQKGVETLPPAHISAFAAVMKAKRRIVIMWKQSSS